MILQVKDITGALNKISEIVKGDKNVPGVMLNITDNLVDVCYNDGHKAFIEKINALTDDTDFKGKIVLPFENFVRAIANCQPSGSIKVNDIAISFLPNNMMKIKAERYIESSDGENSTTSKVGTKTMDIQYIDVANTQDQKARLLDRMNYETIFEIDGNADTWDKNTLISIFNTVSAEKGRSVYMSPKVQKIYVVNTAYTCAVPAPLKEVTQEDKDALMGELAETGEQALFEEKAAKLAHIMTGSACIATNISSIVASVLNKTSVKDEEADDSVVYLHNKDGYICICNHDNSVGLYFEQAKPSKVHIGSFERYAGFDYTKYNITVLREVLVDCIKSAVNSSKNEKTSFTFRTTEDGNRAIVIVAQNSGASVSDTYDVVIDKLECAGGNDDLDSKVITISLKSFAEMLGQLKSDFIAIDISEDVSGQICMRLAEVDIEKIELEWKNARTALGLPLVQAADQPMPPTPIDTVMGYRAKTLNTCQYSLVTVASK